MKEKIYNYLNKEVVLIYQMGKVGSTSIEESLKETNFCVEHIHSFHSPIAYETFKHFKSVKYYMPISVRIKDKFVGALKKCLIKRKRELKIITLVREPISRNISMFFQDIHIPIFELAKVADNRYENNVNKEALQKIFLEKFNHCYGINWFDDEFKKTFGIDIYKYEFDKDKGYSIYKERNINLMVIKMEKLNELELEIGEFLGLENFKLSNSNRGDKKWYSELYKNFKKDFIPTKEYIDMLYNSKYMKHFYTESEIEEFKAKWLKVKYRD